ncbi:L,D-transpeptidase [Leptolyngbya sp. BL0902]|uniref:L,D-transpeptidase n=1 Tax=Leptolyngbya sp. BL0902 TaxID=1115757 RepID=UPI0018E8D066|nr:L,D-transpeptidase [Leptolyngbya sp. BL0902]QQE63527.1 L,D-transpeptidase [Leptolyngbya sp. BL0902]
MEKPSAVRRCGILICYGAAGLLAAGAWRDYYYPNGWHPDAPFQPMRLARLTLPLRQAPESLLTANTRIEVHLQAREIRLYQNEQVILQAPVAVGQDGWQTPIGEFAVRDMRINPVWRHPITQEPVGPGPSNPLGSRWIGFLVEGGYHIGIHGTNQENLIGEAVSHGCVRMLEKDIQALYGHIQLGTPVVVKP